MVDPCFCMEFLPAYPSLVVCIRIWVNLHICIYRGITQQESVQKCFHLRSLYIRQHAMAMICHDGESEPVCYPE